MNTKLHTALTNVLHFLGTHLKQSEGGEWVETPIDTCQLHYLALRDAQLGRCGGSLTDEHNLSNVVGYTAATLYSGTGFGGTGDGMLHRGRTSCAIGMLIRLLKEADPPQPVAPPQPADPLRKVSVHLPESLIQAVKEADPQGEKSLSELVRVAVDSFYRPNGGRYFNVPNKGRVFVPGAAVKEALQCLEDHLPVYAIITIRKATGARLGVAKNIVDQMKGSV